ncbi:MAG TPA: hypothetical protein VFX96_06325 [Pyrinomonadaceae bacterium]|nr:hypothetical protein [Pyrinomonadaceae bacterium]
MKNLFAACALCALTILASACAAGDAAQTNANSSATTRASNANSNTSGVANTSAPPSVAPAHNSGSNDANAAPSNSNVRANAGAQSERALVDTKALDEKIEKALPKAKGEGASASARAEAAAAYLERGNVYFSAGNPRLYKYALADFNSVLLYEPTNAEAKTKRDEIVRIYKDMGRPVPQVSNEQ